MADHFQGCPLKHGHYFLDDNGQLQKRQDTCLRIDIPNIDRMTIAELEEFLAKRDSTLLRFARRIFPGRPRGHVGVASKLYIMARIRIWGIPESPISKRRQMYERYYKSLPRWAKWRIGTVDVAAMIPNGKSIRLTPRRRR